MRITQIKQWIKILSGRKTWIRAEIKCNRRWYGTEYGGFYLNPDILNKQSIVYSFGVGEDISFDNMVIEQKSCKVFAFDPTPKSIEWVKKQHLPPSFSFFPFGIDSITGYVKFNLPKNKRNVSGSILNHPNVDENNTVLVPMKSFTDITKELGHDKIDVLKIDIEGSEYEIMESVLSSGIEITQIVLEIHERFFKDGKSKTAELLAYLKLNGYSIFAVSESMEEISFIKMSPISAV